MEASWLRQPFLWRTLSSSLWTGLNHKITRSLLTSKLDGLLGTLHLTLSRGKTSLVWGGGLLIPCGPLAYTYTNYTANYCHSLPLCYFFLEHPLWAIASFIKCFSDITMREKALTTYHCHPYWPRITAGKFVSTHCLVFTNGYWLNQSVSVPQIHKIKWSWTLEATSFKSKEVNCVQMQFSVIQCKYDSNPEVHSRASTHQTANHQQPTVPLTTAAITNQPKDWPSDTLLHNLKSTSIVYKLGKYLDLALSHLPAYRLNAP